MQQQQQQQQQQLDICQCFVMDCRHCSWQPLMLTWLNQSMVQQLIREGNMRQRARNASPTGDMASTMCRLSRALRVVSRDYMLCHCIHWM
jgi:hypothetical protein